MSIKYNVRDHIQGLELFTGRKYSGTSYWDSLYRFPESGLAYYYGTLGNNDVFGKAHAIYPYFSASFYEGRKYRSGYLVGVGISFMTRTFDLENNKFNIVIGSHLNAFLKFAIQNDFRLSEQLYLTNEIVLIHSSNGRIKSPNKGLNIVTTNIGLKYFLKEPEISVYNEIPGLTDRNSFDFTVAYATKMIDHFNTGRFNVYALTFDYSRTITHKRELMIGIDCSYDGSLVKLISDFTGEQALKKQAIRLGLHAGQEVRFNNIGIIMQAGIYLHNNLKKSNQKLYQRYGIRYYIINSIYAEAVLKTHLGVADYLTWGIGYKF